VTAATASRQTTPSQLPDYFDQQAAFHCSFRPELHAILDELPLLCGARVLDAPCGDGFYSRRLAERLGSDGALYAADASDAYLSLARRALSSPDVKATVHVDRADVYNLPFDDDFFDLVWCAQSLITLDDPAAALRELARVTRPGGKVAVLEGDEFHHVLLPWPVELELGIHRALQEASRVNCGDRAKLAPSRRVHKMMVAAGLRPPRRKTFAADRRAPLSMDEARFLRAYLRSLGDFIRDHLRPAERVLFDGLTGDEGMVRDEALELTCLNVVHLARKPRRRGSPE